jgi:hypothetical protein
MSSIFHQPPARNNYPPALPRIEMVQAYNRAMNLANDTAAQIRQANIRDASRRAKARQDALPPPPAPTLEQIRHLEARHRGDDTQSKCCVVSAVGTPCVRDPLERMDNSSILRHHHYTGAKNVIQPIATYRS